MLSISVISANAARHTPICASCARRLTAGSLRWSSTDATPPPLLSKLKGDLKAAMVKKDKARLNVLRAIISEVNNASKTSSPVTSDLQILTLLKKSKVGKEAAQKEARDNSREDIYEKQQSEIDVLDEYATEVKMMTEEDVASAVRETIEKLKAASPDVKPGPVLKDIFQPGGSLFEKAVDRSQVAKIVNGLLSGKS